MSNGWASIDKAKDSGMFLKIEAGKSVTAFMVGEPYSFYQIFKDKKEYTEYVPGSSFRFKINVAILENGTFTMKIFNQGVTVAKTLRKLIQKLGPDQIFDIEREGSTKDDTTYHIIPLGKASPEQIAQIKALKPHSLIGKDLVDTSFDTEEMDADAQGANY